MNAVNLKQFLARATPYEQWVTPLDPRLRRAALLSGGIMIAFCLSLPAAPALSALINYKFSLVGQDTADKLIQAGPYLLALNLIGIACLGLIYRQTDRLRQGSLNWQYGVGVPLAISGVDSLILFIMTAIILLNLLVVVGMLLLALWGASKLIGVMACW